MSISVRIAVVAAVTCVCQLGWAQYPIEGTIIESPAVGFPIEGTIVDGGIVNGGIVSDGFTNGGVVYAGSEIPSTQVVSGASSVSYNAPVNSGNGGGSILDVVNQKRRRSGLPALMFDAGLTQVAQNKSNIRANRRITGHDGSARGQARVEGVGYAYGGNLTQRFNTCYLYANGYSRAGAAISYDNSGRAYYTLLLR